MSGAQGFQLSFHSNEFFFCKVRALALAFSVFALLFDALAYLLEFLFGTLALQLPPFSLPARSQSCHRFNTGCS